jgi:cupin fold WbuC family metalloprotein
MQGLHLRRRHRPEEWGAPFSNFVAEMIAMTQESPEVFYTAEPIVAVGAAELQFLKQRARENPRRRTRLCTHSGPADRLHEMIIVHHRDCYVRPHRHRTNSESLHVIEGSADVVVFDESGAITTSFTVSEAGSGGTFYYRMPAMQFHTLLITAEWFIFHETTSGPFRRENTEFPAWAPDGTAEGPQRAYLARVRSVIGGEDSSSRER